MCVFVQYNDSDLIIDTVRCFAKNSQRLSLKFLTVLSTERMGLPWRLDPVLQRSSLGPIKVLNRGGRDFPELDIALGAVVDSIVPDGQPARIEGGDVGELSAYPVLS